MFLAAVVCAANALFAAERPLPQVSFDRGGVQVAGVRPGTRIAWLGLIREPRQTHSLNRIVRGFEVATPNGSLSIPSTDADRARGLWVVADVGTGAAVHAKTARAVTVGAAIGVEAAAGNASVSIASSTIELLYVRPPARAWTFSVDDGGGLDGDGVQNGKIVVALQSLQALHGQAGAPAAIESGDVLLLLDARYLRTATVEIP